MFVKMCSNMSCEHTRPLNWLPYNWTTESHTLVGIRSFQTWNSKLTRHRRSWVKCPNAVCCQVHSFFVHDCVGKVAVVGIISSDLPVPIMNQTSPFFIINVSKHTSCTVCICVHVRWWNLTEKFSGYVKLGVISIFQISYS